MPVFSSIVFIMQPGKSRGNVGEFVTAVFTMPINKDLHTVKLSFVL